MADIEGGIDPALEAIQDDEKYASNDALYVSDREIIRRLGFGEKRGYQIIQELARDRPNRRRYPQKDPLFCGRRFWPAVLQWHMDYHGVRFGAESREPVTVKNWQENFDAVPARKSKSSK